jgi:hypothetical protein
MLKPINDANNLSFRTDRLTVIKSTTLVLHRLAS